MKQLTLLIGSLREGSFLAREFLFIRQIEKHLLDSANTKSANLPEKWSPLNFIMKTYVDKNTLKIQLRMLPDVTKVANINAWCSHKAGYMCTNVMSSI